MITKQKIVDRMEAYRARLGALMERVKRYPEILHVGNSQYKLSYGDTYVSVEENGISDMYVSFKLNEFADARVENVESLIAFKDAIENSERAIKNIHNMLDKYDIDKARILSELDDFFN